MHHPVSQQPVQYTTESDTHDLWPLVDKTKHAHRVSPIQLAPLPQRKLLTQRNQNLLLLAEHAGAAVISTIVLVVSMGLMIYGPSSEIAAIRVPANYLAAVVTPVAEVSYIVLDSLFPNVIEVHQGGIGPSTGK